MTCTGPGLPNEPSPADTFLTASATQVALSPGNHGPRAIAARRCAWPRGCRGWESLSQATAGGARASRLARCPRREAMTAGSVMSTNTFTDQPQREQRLRSMSNTPRSRCIHVIEAPGGADMGSSDMGSSSVHTRASAGCLPSTPARWRAWGANTPWYRMRGGRGRGTHAARGARKSSGSNRQCVVPSRKGRLSSCTPRPSPSIDSLCDVSGAHAI